MYDLMKPPVPPEPQPWYTIAGIGDLGLEMFHSGQDQTESYSVANRMSLRARFNSHRNVKVYSWLEDFKVTEEKIKGEYLAEVLKSATVLY